MKRMTRKRKRNVAIRALVLEVAHVPVLARGVAVPAARGAEAEDVNVAALAGQDRVLERTLQFPRAAVVLLTVAFTCQI